jgi:hypothetical protein
MLARALIVRATINSQIFWRVGTSERLRQSVIDFQKGNGPSAARRFRQNCTACHRVRNYPSRFWPLLVRLRQIPSPSCRSDSFVGSLYVKAKLLAVVKTPATTRGSRRKKMSHLSPPFRFFWNRSS